MKRSLIALCMFIFVMIVHAQLLPRLTDFIYQSAITPQNEIKLRMISNEYLPAMNFEAFTIRNGNINTVPLTPINPSEQTAIITAPSNSLPQIGFRAESDAINIVIPWEVSTDQAAESQYYIRSGVSPEGITTGVGDDIVDLREQSFSLTSTSINVMLKNAAGTYPSSISFSSQQPYVYGTMIINADILFVLGMDLETFNLEEIDPQILAGIYAYALIYSGLSFPPLSIDFGSGIYKLPLAALLNPEDNISTILNSVPIGTITHSINNGALLIRANYSDFVNEEDFGSWPNFTNCLVAIPFAIRVANLLTLTVELDICSPTIVFCSPYNVLPQTNMSVNLELGPMTPMLYQVYYTSQGDFYPFYARFTRENGSVVQGMSDSIDFTTTSTFYFPSTTPLGNGTFSFSVDNANVSSLPYIWGSCSDEVEKPISGLLGNYPNPFNPSTTIDFAVPRTGQVSIDVYNVRGQRVKRVVSGSFSGGRHSVIWDGVDDSGMVVGGGVYFYRMECEDGVSVKKMVMVK